MRDSNYKSVSANKAAVSITTSLYDRRALDCTDDKPLVNSLNHLTFLTSSSARVRETLATDGGLERLIDILYECKNPTSEREMSVFGWKWILAFQCLVLIGTRGSEKIRKKVVNAGMIPVIATVLDNYLIANSLEGIKDMRQSILNFARVASPTRSPILESATEMTQLFNSVRTLSEEANIRADETILGAEATLMEDQGSTATSGASTGDANAPAESKDPGIPSSIPQMNPSDSNSEILRQIFLLHFINRINNSEDVVGINRELAKVYTPMTRDVLAVNYLTNEQSINNIITENINNGGERLSFLTGSVDSEHSQYPRKFQKGILIPKEEDVIWSLQVLAFISKYPMLKPELSNTYIIRGMSLRTQLSEPSPFGLSHSVPGLDTDDGNDFDTEYMLDSTSDEESDDIPSSCLQDTDSNVIVQTSNAKKGCVGGCELVKGFYDYLFCEYEKTCSIEDRLQRATEMEKLSVNICDALQTERNKLILKNAKLQQEKEQSQAAKWDYDSYEHFEIPEGDETDKDLSITSIMDVNIFPLVERFTVRGRHSKDICYWAGVIVKNSCRKDESKGGVRQCAYFECGKWEQYPRQFAKCKNCKRTKYCSKECQKKAWEYHKHWCSQSNSSSSASSSVSQPSTAAANDDWQANHAAFHRDHAHMQGHQHQQQTTIPPSSQESETQTQSQPEVLTQQLPQHQQQQRFSVFPRGVNREEDMDYSDTATPGPGAVVEGLNNFFPPGTLR